MPEISKTNACTFPAVIAVTSVCTQELPLLYLFSSYIPLTVGHVFITTDLSFGIKKEAKNNLHAQCVELR